MGYLKKHLGHWNEISEISCSLCGEAWEDSWRLWAFCPALSDKELRTRIQKSKMTYEGGMLYFLRDKKIQESMALNEAFIRPD